MDYYFPIIIKLDDIRPYIAGADEFIIAEREWGYVVNYLVSMEDTFPDTKDNHLAQIRRECRGLKFDKNGFILARPYHKFFNVNERGDTQIENIDLSKSHVVLEKLDGSMIHPIQVDGDVQYRLVSKMGITDVALQAEQFVASNQNYHRFMLDCVKAQCTPIFEWCSRKNRIVIDYPEDRLVLTAVRDTLDGTYMSYAALTMFASAYDVEVVQRIANEREISDLIEFVRGLKDQEGFVIRFDDGHMLKMKAEDYLRMHRARDSLSHEKNVIYIIFNDLYDDFISALHGTDKERLEEYYAKVMKDFDAYVNSVTEELQLIKSTWTSRKDFALNARVGDDIRKLAFKYWDVPTVTKQDVWSDLQANIQRSCGSQAHVDRVRHMWGNHYWANGAVND